MYPIYMTALPTPVTVGPGGKPGGRRPGGGGSGGPGPGGRNGPVGKGQAGGVLCGQRRDRDELLGDARPRGARPVRTGPASGAGQRQLACYDDNPIYNTKPFVSASNPAYTGDLAKPARWKRSWSGRTARRRWSGSARIWRSTPRRRPSGGQGSAPTPPRTFGETLQIRLERAATLEKIVYAAVALTLIVAGCSLAVAVGGGLVDRKRPFTLLRVSGTQVGVLSRVVLLEAAVPLVAATVVAAGIAYGTSTWAFVRLARAGTAIPQLGSDYYALMGIGLAVAFGVITVTLPLLRRMTSPGNVRFE